MKVDILGWHKIVFSLTRLVQVSGDSLNIYIYTVAWIQKVRCQLVQKMTVLTVNDYCSGESGAQPANTNPSLETKETKVGAFTGWLQFTSGSTSAAAVRSGLKRSPCNWAFTHNAAWKSLDWCYSSEWVWAREGWEVYLHGGDCCSHTSYFLVCTRTRQNRAAAAVTEDPCWRL